MFLELLTIYYFFIAVILFLHKRQELPYVNSLLRFKLEICIINIIFFIILFYRYIENYAVCMLLSLMSLSLAYILYSLKFTDLLKEVRNF